MEILSVTLCDAAADYQGKLCILGAFDSIYAAQFPCVHPACSVAIRILLRDEDVGAHTVGIVFINPDGQPLTPIENLPVFNFQVSPMPAHVFFASQNFVLNWHGLQAQEPGQYEIRIFVDAEIARTIPFQFVQVQPNLGHA
jgi:hypothetical protein